MNNNINTKMKNEALLLIAWLMAFQGWLIGADEFIRVELEIESQSFMSLDDQKNPVKPKRTFPATCVVSPDRWQIVSSFPVNATETYYFDGENVFGKYNITSLPTVPAEQKSPRPIVSNTSPYQNVYVTKGDHPMGSLGVNIIWLAYCSGAYLATQDRLLPIPGLPVREAFVHAFACEDETYTFQDQFGLPRKISFHVKKAALAKEGVHELLYRSESNAPERFLGLLPPGEKDGLLKAQYTVQSETNFLGITFPLRFSYFQYWARKEDQWDKQLEVNGKVLEISKADEPASLLEDGKLQYVTDMRFRHPRKRVDSISYVHTNSVLPPTNDPILKNVFDEKVAARPVDQLGSRQSRFKRFEIGSPFVILTIIILLAPLGFLLIRQLNSKKIKN